MEIEPGIDSWRGDWRRTGSHDSQDSSSTAPTLCHRCRNLGFETRGLICPKGTCRRIGKGRSRSARANGRTAQGRNWHTAPERPGRERFMSDEPSDDGGLPVLSARQQGLRLQHNSLVKRGLELVAKTPAEQLTR